MTAVGTGTKTGSATERALPYAGPRSLHEGEPIYGRSREINELRGSILSERIVLLYSPSGAGKTSLIEAGLRPELASRRFQMLPTIRVGYAPPPDAAGVNRYRLSVLSSLEEGRHLERQFAPDELESMLLKDYLRDRADEEPDLDPCLIFDQFEEVFTLDPADWTEKEAFLHELGDALHDRGFFALFSMREDFIAQLDPYRDLMPTRFGNRYRLGLLGPAAAKDAIQKPAASAGVDFTDAAADRLIDDLRRIKVERGAVVSEELGPSVEPVQLQVVCSRLWANLSPQATAIQPGDIAAAGSVNQALGDFYSHEVRTVAGRTRVKEHLIRDWFEENLITDDGFRTQTRDGPGTSGPAVLEGLENAHLIRADRRRGALWYELTHDRFVEPIRFSNAQYRGRRRKKNTRRAVIAAGAAVLLLLVLIAVSLSNRDAAPFTEIPPTMLQQNADQQSFELDATGFKTFQFDDGRVGEEVTVVIRSTPATELDLRLLRTDAVSGGAISVSPAGALAPQEQNQGPPVTSTVLTTRQGLMERQYLLPADGTYVIEITSKTDITDTDVSFTLDYVKTSEPSIPEVILGQPVEGVLGAAGEVSRFAVSGNEGDEITVVLDPHDSFDGVLAFFDQDGTAVQSADSWPGGVRELMIQTLPSAGTYSVEVSGFDDSSGTYSLLADRRVIEELSKGAPISGAIDGNDVDVFSFEASPNEVLRFTATPTTASLDIIIEAIGPSGLRQTRDLGVAGVREEIVVSSVGGRYLVSISGFAGSSGSYEVEVVAPDLVEIVPGDSMSGVVVPGDPLHYSFFGLAGELYSIVDHPTDLLRFEVAMPYAYSIVASTFIAPYDGVYAITVDALRETDFEMSLIRPEVLDIDFGDTVAASVDRPGQSPAYRFDAAEGDSYTITLTPFQDGYDPWLVVTAPDGFVETLDVGLGAEPVTVAGIAPVDGWYLVTWDDLAPSGAYELTLEH